MRIGAVGSQGIGTDVVASPHYAEHTAWTPCPGTFLVNDSLPLVSAGTQVFAATFTAKHSGNRIRVRAGGCVTSATAANNAFVALFIDDICRRSRVTHVPAVNAQAFLALSWAGVLAPGQHHYQIRIGGQNGVDGVHINGSISGRYQGGAFGWDFSILEVPTI